MSDDIRLKISFKDHRKRKKANLLLGLQKSATDYILDLWISCAQNHPTGELAGMDEVDIALEAGWEGDPHAFIEAMVAARVIDCNGDGYRIHDWEEHQGWVYHSKERSELARKAVNARWDRVKQGLSKAEGIRNVYEPHTASNTPSPSPSPSHKEEKELASPASLKLLVVQLDKKCKAVNTLPKKKEKFNPHQWVQWCANHRYHPQAVAMILDSLIEHWQEIANPWTWATTVIQRESGNFYERDGTRNTEKEKSEWVDLINRLKTVHGG